MDAHWLVYTMVLVLSWFSYSSVTVLDEFGTRFGHGLAMVWLGYGCG